MPEPEPKDAGEPAAAGSDIRNLPVPVPRPSEVARGNGEGWVALPEAFDDGGWSGGNMDRPALTKLLCEIDKGRVDMVVVYKIDRLTRSLADFADEAADVAPGESFTVQIRPDVIVQVSIFQST